MKNKNKFEHLMTDRNHEELEKDGKTIITQYSKAWRREMEVATVKHYITYRLPYYVAKKILNDTEYCYKRNISIDKYDANTKTVELNGLYPTSRLKIIDECESAKVVNDYYSYGV